MGVFCAHAKIKMCLDQTEKVVLDRKKFQSCRCTYWIVPFYCSAMIVFVLCIYKRSDVTLFRNLHILFLLNHLSLVFINLVKQYVFVSWPIQMWHRLNVSASLSHTDLSQHCFWKVLKNFFDQICASGCLLDHVC